MYTRLVPILRDGFNESKALPTAEDLCDHVGARRVVPAGDHKSLAQPDLSLHGHGTPCPYENLRSRLPNG